jgi:hypothetical protein
MQLFEERESVEDVALFIEEHLKIAEITKHEARRLDYEPHHLKKIMPTGWNWEEGDKMARLKQAGISLSPDVGK